MGSKKKKKFLIKIEDEGWGRTEFHRPTRSMKELRDELRNEELEKEINNYDGYDEGEEEEEVFEHGSGC